MGTESAVISNSEAGSLTEFEIKIVKQVEYYFGDVNLSGDKFLREKIKEDDGWVPLETMITFNRLKNLTCDIAIIASALKKSTNSLIEVSEDEKKIRRRTDKPVPEISDLRKELDEKTVYAKGLSVKSSLDELLQYFKEFGTIEGVYMKRLRNKSFKGSVFVTFATKDEAEKFLKLENVKLNNVELLRESKFDYKIRKHKEFEERKVLKERKKRTNDEVVKEESVPKIEHETSETPIEKGSILKLSGLSENTMWEHIKEVLCPHADVAYVDYSKGKPEAYVRFEKPVAAEVLDKVVMEGDGVKKVKICDVEAIALILEGEEEDKYLEKVSKLKFEMKNKMSFKFKRGNRGQNHGRHFRGGGRKQFGRRHRHGDRREDFKESREERPTKMQKIE